MSNSFVGQKATLFVTDLKNSWYFRLWLGSSSACFIVGFVAFILFFHATGSESELTSWKTWTTVEDEAYYPPFSIRLPTESSLNLLSAECTLKGVASNGRECHAPLVSKSVCQSFTEMNWKIKKSDYDHDSSSVTLRCEISTNSTSSDSLHEPIIWDLSSNTLDVTATNMQQILPGQAEISLYREEWKSGNDVTTYFTQKLNYGPVFHQNTYNIDVVIGSFKVTWYQEVKPSLLGWKAAGETGGFMFFLVVLHKTLMLIIGCFISNDSQSLKSDEQGVAPGYTAL